MERSSRKQKGLAVFWFSPMPFWFKKFRQEKSRSSSGMNESIAYSSVYILKSEWIFLITFDCYVLALPYQFA